MLQTGNVAIDKCVNEAALFIKTKNGVAAIESKVNKCHTFYMPQ